jgi:hypothetical protein
MDRPLFQAVVFDRRGLDLRESPSRIGDVATVTLRWPAWMLVLTAALPACSFLGSESARITERAGASRGGAVRGPGAVTEIAIGYPATSGQPPRLFRFELQVQGAPAPPDAAPRRLGGKSGVLAFAAGADRARFFWDERGVRYAASLLDLGPRTVPALDALVRALRPVSELRLGGRDDARRRVTTFPVPVRGPVSLAAAGPYLFVAGQGSAAVPPASSQAPAVVRMSASRMRALGEPATVDGSPGTVAIMHGESVIWVTHRAPGAVPLQLMDPGTGRFFGPAHGALQPVAVAVGFDAVWIVDLQGGYVRRADTRCRPHLCERARRTRSRRHRHRRGARVGHQRARRHGDADRPGHKSRRGDHPRRRPPDRHRRHRGRDLGRQRRGRDGEPHRPPQQPGRGDDTRGTRPARGHARSPQRLGDKRAV